jgi:hypothetical protein
MKSGRRAPAPDIDGGVERNVTTGANATGESLTRGAHSYTLTVHEPISSR